jgi:MYXO-CTERM domain-containing protein
VLSADELKDGEPFDTNHDGTPDYLDDDDDGDGIRTRTENRGKNRDLDDDGIPNYLDTDADGDGFDDADELTSDLDGDGVPDYRDPPNYGAAGGALCAAATSGEGTRGGMLLVWGLLAACVILLKRRGRNGEQS